MIESIVRCDNYDQDALNAAVERHFAALNVEALLRPDMRVVIKPNLVGARRPEAAATTHPNLVRAVAVWLHARGVQSVVICDSPGGLYAVAPLQNIYAVTGMKALSDVAELNADVSFQTVRTKGGGAIPSFNIVTPIATADLVINIAKLKTHSMTLLSAGVKNLFGCVPGLQKPELHYRHPDIEDFSNMLVELARTVSPALTLIDAIDGMEGDGPTGGTVRHLGLTLAARDLFTQDWFACSLIGIEPERVAMLRRAKALGLIDERVEIAGDEPIYAEPPFKQPRATGVDFTGRLPEPLKKPLRAVLGRLLKPYPKLDVKKCVGCGKCAESCPPKIIVIADRRAHFTRRGCISCFCCQEMCPAKAIGVKRSLSRLIR